MPKRLYRSQKNRMLAGICAGLADYFDIDMSLVRLIFVALAFLTALLPMAIFYIIAWIIVPIGEEKAEQSKPAKTTKDNKG
ncbi:PspC domain-containing protein [Acidobacteriota bacterium]